MKPQKQQQKNQEAQFYAQRRLQYSKLMMGLWAPDPSPSHVCFSYAMKNLAYSILTSLLCDQIILPNTLYNMVLIFSILMKFVPHMWSQIVMLTLLSPSLEKFLQYQIKLNRSAATSFSFASLVQTSGSSVAS